MCDRWWISLYTEVGWQKPCPPLHGLVKERIWSKCLHPGFAPRHRVPGSLPYFLLVLQFGNSGGPLVNLVSGTSFPRIPAPGQCGKGWVFPNSMMFGQVSEQFLVGCLRNPARSPRLPNTPCYSCSGTPISYYLFGLENSGLCPNRMGR